MATTALPRRRPLAERDVLVDLTPAHVADVGLTELDDLLGWLSLEV